MADSTAKRLIGQVLRRLRAAAVGLVFYRATLAAAGVFLVALFVGKTLGILPGPFEFYSPLVILPVALLVALLFHRRHTEVDAARAIDLTVGAKDLFLTASLLGEGGAIGEFKPLVATAAEEKARGIDADRIVPWNWGPRAITTLLVMGVLILAATLSPVFDPFGKQEEANRIAERQERIKEAVKTVSIKKKALEQREVEAENSAMVASAMQQLMQSLQQMKPELKQANMQRLNDQQRAVNELWRKKSEERLREQSNNAQRLKQRFGNMDNQSERKRLKDEMSRGDASGVKKEIDEIRQMAKELSKTDDPAKADQLRKTMQEKLQNLSDLASKDMKSEAVQDAVQQALEQLEASNMDGVKNDAMKGLQESLDLTDLEMEQLAQSIRDGEALEEAMKALQNARRLNNAGQMDGEQLAQCNNVGDYADMLEKMGMTGSDGSGGSSSEGQGDGQGDGQGNQPGNGQGGMGGQGQGRGMIAPEKDDEVTDFKDEKSPAQFQAGKILMQWKTEGKAEAGETRMSHVEAQRALKQGVNEAIIKEQIPPGYHDSIKKYFDNMDAAPAPVPAPPEPTSNDAAE